ncbi:MAG: response regulator [SAR324 cluster bacterium]|nr:response regulator [SAR324 cluster bacterium]
MKFLVVEDNIPAQNLLHKILIEFGEVELCATAEDGLANFSESLKSESLYDMIFVDFELPGMNGDKFVEEIRKLEKGGKRTPISITSGVADEKDIESCNKCGADWSIHKPYIQSEIVEFIQACNANKFQK